MTRWLDPQPINTDALNLLDLHPLLAQILVRRGIKDPKSARAFLNPDSYVPTPLFELPRLEKAVGRIMQAIRRAEPICVWGDFDVDGQTSTCLLVQTLHALGSHVTYYIPIRGKEGHGIHIESLAPIIDIGVKLIITCDTGITAYKALDYAHSRGVDVIVTDHHELGEMPPNAVAIVNPRLLPDDHPLANLAGVGVAYELADAVLDPQFGIVNDHSQNPTCGLRSEDLHDLVALGSIADVAVLRNDTRFLVQKGIHKLRATKRIGLTIIAQQSDTDLETLTEETIGFVFAPRLNALGRLGDANPAVELLLTQNPSRASVLATQIEGLNTQRRLLTSQVYAAAKEQLRENPELLSGPAIVLSHAHWPGGVVGIAANKLAEDYHKAVILLTQSDDGILRGSARSVDGLHITEAIKANKKYLLGFGGHPMAAGLALEPDQLPGFRRAFCSSVEKMLDQPARDEPTLHVDAWLTLASISLDLARVLEQIAPFGAGNPPVILATRGLALESAREIGRTKEHRRLVVIDSGGAQQEVLWWGGALEALPEAFESRGSRFDLAYSIRASTYRGERRISLEFVDYRIVEEAPLKISRRRLEILDMRSTLGRLEGLPSGTLVWTEGPDKHKGFDRAHLRPADKFAIWTAPPSPAELRAALDIVKPKTIYLFGAAPAPEGTDAFIERLAGMVKFIINRRSGQARLVDLAAATTESTTTIRLGLEWLAAGGYLRIQNDRDELRLSIQSAAPNQYLQRGLYVAIAGLLEETAAYRRYFLRADAESLFQI